MAFPGAPPGALPFSGCPTFQLSGAGRIDVEPTPHCQSLSPRLLCDRNRRVATRTADRDPRDVGEQIVRRLHGFNVDPVERLFAVRADTSHRSTPCGGNTLAVHGNWLCLNRWRSSHLRFGAQFAERCSGCANSTHWPDARNRTFAGAPLPNRVYGAKRSSHGSHSPSSSLPGLAAQPLPNEQRLRDFQRL